ncbi:MAG: family 78 glycoside hydrolase catalytic domain [Oscillospiraceae bacterium]|jgi:alpha-L-rhamnosidase|nr:family 78 glycoside hydrolase catalytic domain [Oscillospiraceae bacterium]
MTHEEVFREARWVSPSAPCDQPILQTVFDAGGQPAAQLTVCGLGFVEPWLNGERVSEDLLVPAWTSYEFVEFQNDERWLHDDSIHRICYLTYDLRLRPGENTLELHLGGGWYRRWNYGARVKACFRIDWPDGRALFSDGSIQWRPSEIVRSKILKGETHDFTLGRQDWRPAALVEPPAADFVPQTAPTDRVIRRIIPRALGGGLYDCGENITGWPVLRLESAGEVTVSYAENLDGREHYGANWIQNDVFLSDGTPREAHARFLWHAFRFFRIEGPAEVLRVEVVQASVAVASSFQSDSTLLNWLYDAFLRTQLCNMHCGIPSDCPQCEGRGYTGDGQLACDAALLLLDGRAFYQKWVRDIADGQDRQTGHINYTAPFIPSGGGPGGWGCAIVHVPYVYHQYYGDRAPLEAYYPHMKRWLDYLEAHSDADLVVSEEPGNWCLGDWCTPGTIQIPEPFVNTYFYIKSLGEMQEIAALLGREEDLPALRALESRKRGALLRACFDPATGDFCGNIQGANAFAVDLGMGDERTFARMTAHYRETGQYDTGIFGTDIVTRVLLERGEAQLAFDLLTSEGEVSWGEIRRRGSTTIWEYWDGTRSHSHPMFGAVLRYLFRDFLGIAQRPGTVGFTDLILCPQLVEGMDRCAGHIETARGRVAVGYQKSGERITFTAEIPQGTIAQLRLPQGEHTLTEGRYSFVV